jgi:CHORD
VKKPEPADNAGDTYISELPAAPRVGIPAANKNTFNGGGDSQKPARPVPEPETEDDDASLVIPPGTTCRRRACNTTYDSVKDRSDDEECVHHPGHPLFHEGQKGWTCCKPRVLDFDDFLGIKGCTTKKRHLFVGKGKSPTSEEKLQTVRLVSRVVDDQD